MIKQIELKILPEEIHDEDLLRRKAIKKSRLPEARVKAVKLVRRSIDARGSRPFYRVRMEVFSGESPTNQPSLTGQLKNVHKADPAIVVGAGPAGYFAALELIERGIRPVVLDRGKTVRERRRDLRAIQQFGEVDPHSNYCFGEGGAGTYSDGKLYTRSHKRGNIAKILQLLVEHGAKEDILVDAHPHIGSNKLPNIVAAIRETIIRCGGAVHFNSQVTDLILTDGKIRGVVVNDAQEYLASAVILATGHSARDIYRLLQRLNISVEQKTFALGVRIEHPQPLIDRIQYNQSPREEGLPASSYRLACQVGDRGVYSFCMCPGGLVVPAATAPGEIVVNGMSLSRRDSPYANSGTVTSIEPADIASLAGHGEFAGLVFQQSVEKSVFDCGDGSQRAPAQRLTDFVEGKLSSALPPSSYIPGLHSAPLHEILPGFIVERLQQAIREFGKKMKGYYSGEANVIATESRTSSPIRIPRHPDTLMHVEVEGLFPCGEGAGYAGGIVSAALDGQNVARAVVRFYTQT